MLIPIKQIVADELKLFMANYDRQTLDFHYYVMADGKVIKQYDESFVEREAEGTEGEDDYIPAEIIPLAEKELFEKLITWFEGKALDYIERNSIKIGAVTNVHDTVEIDKVQLYEEYATGERYITITGSLTGSGISSKGFTKKIDISDLSTTVKSKLGTWRTNKENNKKTELGL